MVKAQAKSKGIQTNPLISPNQTPKLDNKLSKIQDQKEDKSTKSRQQIYSENYQKNKEQKKQQRRERYQQQKEREQEQLSKYYEAEAIKVLMSLKEYTELNSAKRKTWLDFIWTFKDLNKVGISNIIEVMRLRELAENLINDYWTTAKGEIKKGKSWNSLDQEQKDRLIKYWGYEKTRIENNYLTEEERLERQSREYLKEIELAKFHEERGKIKCSCYACESKKEIQTEVKKNWEKDLGEYDRQSGASEKEECPSCGKLKVLDEESEVCKGCVEKYE